MSGSFWFLLGFGSVALASFSFCFKLCCRLGYLDQSARYAIPLFSLAVLMLVASKNI